MTTLRKLSYQNIYLFDDDLASHSNPLKGFIYYLKSTQLKGVIDFSYSDSIDSLHPKLTVKENLILDAIPKSFIRDNLNNFDEIIKKLGNTHLKDMIEFIGNLDTPVEKLSEEKIKIAALMKSLLSEHEYIFLVNPAKFQSKKSIKMIKDCIKFEVENNYKKVLIKSDKRELWLDLATHFITLDMHSKYAKTTNPLLKTGKVDTTYKPTYDFTLVKKVS